MLHRTFVYSKGTVFLVVMTAWQELQILVYVQTMIRSQETVFRRRDKMAAMVSHQRLHLEVLHGQSSTT
jgi:hypothetical protein